MTTYHVDMAAHWAAFREVKDRMLPGGAFAWTVIGIVELADRAFLLEVKAIACVPA